MHFVVIGSKRQLNPLPCLTRLCFTTSFTDSSELLLDVLSRPGETLDDLLSEKTPVSGEYLSSDTGDTEGTVTGHARAITIFNVSLCKLSVMACNVKLSDNQGETVRTSALLEAQNSTELFHTHLLQLILGPVGRISEFALQTTTYLLSAHFRLKNGFSY